jgi:hypothetical protein
MSENSDDVVRVASGTLIQVKFWAAALDDAGITARVVGGELTGGLGTALGDSVELWVHRKDEPAAVATLERVEAEKGVSEAESGPGD